MIIDAHTHIHLDLGADGQTVDDLLKSMDEARIDMAAVFAATINDLPTARLVKEISPHRDRLFAVGTVSPIMDGYKTSPHAVERWLSDGAIRAIKFYTGYEHFYPHDPLLHPYLELLVRYDRPAIFHSGDLYDKIPGAKLKYSHPLEVDDLAADMPDLKIIIAHLGSPWALDAAQVCYKNRNVYADCSGFVYGNFSLAQEERFSELWGTFNSVMEGAAHEKILFGSDWPISGMKDYVRTVRRLASHGYEQVFSGNAKKLFGI